MRVDRKLCAATVVCAALLAAVGLVAGPRAQGNNRAPGQPFDVSFVYRGHVPVLGAKLIFLRNDEALLNARGVRLRFRGSRLVRRRVAALARDVNGGRRNFVDGVVLRSRDGRTHRFWSVFSSPITYLATSPSRVPLATRRDQRLVSFLKGRVRRNLRERVIVRYERRAETTRSGLTVFTDGRVIATRRAGRCRTEATARLTARRVQRLRRRITRAVKPEQVTSRLGRTQDILDFDGGGVLRLRPRGDTRSASPPRAREAALARSLRRLTHSLLQMAHTRRGRC